MYMVKIRKELLLVCNYRNIVKILNNNLITN